MHQLVLFTKGTLHVDVCILMIIPGSVLIRMINVSYVVEKIKNTFYTSIPFFSPKIVPFMS